MTLRTRFRLPDFHVIFRVMNAHVRSDVANAMFTLTSTLKTRNLGVNFQATGKVSGLAEPGSLCSARGLSAVFGVQR